MKLFFDINKIIYKYNYKEKNLVRVVDFEECKDGICLIMNTSTSLEDKNIYNNIFDSDVKNDFIKKELKVELEDFIYNTYIDNKRTFVFGMTKNYFLHLIDYCGFSKVYPLEYMLYKMGSGRNGIVSNDLMLLKRYESEDDYKSNYLKGNSDETMYYLGLSTDIYIRNIERMKEDSDNSHIAIFSDEINNQNDNYGNMFIKDFEDFVKNYSKFYLVDTISNRYKKYILHKYMALGDVVFLGILGLICFFIFQGYTQEKIYESEIEEQKIKIAKFDKLNKEILQEIPKMDFYSFPLKESKDFLIPFTKYNPSKFLYNFDVKKNKINVYMIVNGIANVEELVKFLKEKKYANTYTKKDGYNFEFKIDIDTKPKDIKEGKKNAKN